MLPDSTYILVKWFAPFATAAKRLRRSYAQPLIGGYLVTALLPRGPCKALSSAALQVDHDRDKVTEKFPYQMRNIPMKDLR